MNCIDSHTHLMENRPEELLRQAHEDYHYKKINVLGIPCYLGTLNNLECLLIKAMEPDYAYVYGGMVYTAGIAPDADDHQKQLELMMEAGFDGWKLLESKPACYRALQLPLDSPVFDKAFALAEEKQIPTIWHSGDPATFWSAKTAPKFAVRNHWLCDGEGFPQLNQLYNQVEEVLSRHPRLNATLAHMYFTTDDRPHAQRVLDAYPNLKFDLTPGSEMYAHFMADRAGWTEFFKRYADRLIYGSDMVDDPQDIVFGSQKAIVDLVMKTLTEDEPFQITDIAGRGLKLPEEILQKLFHDNFAALVPEKPKAICPEGLMKYTDWLKPRLSEDEKTACDRLIKKILAGKL